MTTTWCVAAASCLLSAVRSMQVRATACVLPANLVLSSNLQTKACHL